MSVIKRLRNLFDQAFFVLLCLVLLALFIIVKSWDLKFGVGPENGAGPVSGQPSVDNQHPESQQSPDLHERNSTATSVQSLPKPSNIVKLFLGRRGVSDDKIVWHDADQFADFIKQLKDQGIKEVHYLLLPDSIERYEEKWKEELKKAKLIYAELQNDIETDRVSLQP